MSHEPRAGGLLALLIGIGIGIGIGVGIGVVKHAAYKHVRRRK